MLFLYASSIVCHKHSWLQYINQFALLLTGVHDRHLWRLFNLLYS